MATWRQSARATSAAPRYPSRPDQCAPVCSSSRSATRWRWGASTPVAWRRRRCEGWAAATPCSAPMAAACPGWAGSCPPQLWCVESKQASKAGRKAGRKRQASTQGPGRVSHGDMRTHSDTCRHTCQLQRTTYRRVHREQCRRSRAPAPCVWQRWRCWTAWPWRR